jgi:hypothetical protein
VGDEDDEIDEDEEKEARPLRSAVLQLAEILSPKGGRTVRHALRKNVKRSVTRKDDGRESRTEEA